MAGTRSWQRQSGKNNVEDYENGSNPDGMRCAVSQELVLVRNQRGK